MPSRWWPRRRSSALGLPVGVLVVVFFVVPGVRDSYAASERALPAISRIVFHPAFAVAVGVLVALHCAAIALCRAVDSHRPRERAVSVIAILVWGATLLAVMLAILLPLPDLAS